MSNETKANTVRDWYHVKTFLVKKKVKKTEITMYFHKVTQNVPASPDSP